MRRLVEITDVADSRFYSCRIVGQRCWELVERKGECGQLCSPITGGSTTWVGIGLLTTKVNLLIFVITSLSLFCNLLFNVVLLKVSYDTVHNDLCYLLVFNRLQVKV